MTDALSAKHFKDDEAARKYLEALRWPEGPICPHCGVIGRAYATKRVGVYRCADADCRMDFSVTTRSVMERSKIALHKWLLGFYLMCSSKKGVSAHQLHRTLGITYRSAWFMTHRIREAMREGGLVPPTPMGGESKIVEADETYFGKVDEPPTKRTSGKPFIKSGKSAAKRAVVSLVERGGRVRSFHPAVCDGSSVAAIVRENVARETRLMTDESRLYIKVGREFASHETTKHADGEYARGDVHSNSVEGYFSVSAVFRPLA